MNTIIRKTKNLFNEGEAWFLAIRKRENKLLIDGNNSEFSLIKNSLRYWKADPFLFDYNLKTYVFCEMLDRLNNKGVIGVAEVKNGKVGKFKVCLKLSAHLSFPYVYMENGEVFMMPECWESGCIPVFKATKFPYKWEKVFEVAKIYGADTVFLDKKERTYLSTDVKGRKNDNLVYIKDGEAKPVYTDNFFVRSAGKIFEHNGVLIRPAQDCDKTYGNGVIFYQIDDKNGDNFKEHKIFKVVPKGKKKDEFETELNVNTKMSFVGTHTYNLSRDYEIVDLVKRPNYNIFVSVRKLKYAIKHLIRRNK